MQPWEAVCYLYSRVVTLAVSKIASSNLLQPPLRLEFCKIFQSTSNRSLYNHHHLYWDQWLTNVELIQNRHLEIRSLEIKSSEGREARCTHGGVPNHIVYSACSSSACPPFVPADPEGLKARFPLSFKWTWSWGNFGSRPTTKP